MIETGSHEKPLAITPYVSGKPAATRSDFKTLAQAADFAKQQIAAGNRVDIGMMQIPSIWLDKITKRGTSLEDLLRPCKNLAVGSDLLNEAMAYCSTQVNTEAERDQCGLSFYQTGSTTDGLSYATSIEAYAKAHPVESNPINHEIDFDPWQDDPKKQLPAPTFNQEKAIDNSVVTSEDSNTDETDDASDTGSPS